MGQRAGHSRSRKIPISPSASPASADVSWTVRDCSVRRMIIDQSIARKGPSRGPFVFSSHGPVWDGAVFFNLCDLIVLIHKDDRGIELAHLLRLKPRFGEDDHLVPFLEQTRRRPVQA